MYRDDVEPLWFQFPLRIFNGTSHKQDWLQCWEPGGNWIHDKDPISIKENHYGTDRFADILTKISLVDYPDKKVAKIAGVRAEESPRRLLGLTNAACYRDITWGRVESKKLDHYTFYPLYDWSYTDIWKAIFDNGWEYCKLYDYMYGYGIRTNEMRVSNVHHETAIKSLFFMQEIEPKTWNKVVKRLEGINTAKHMKNDLLEPPEKLPYMFDSWQEYRDYLAQHLLDGKSQDIFIKNFKRMDQTYELMTDTGKEKMYKAQISAMLVNDYHLTKLKNFEGSPQVRGFKRYIKGEFTHHDKTNPYIRRYADEPTKATN